MKNFIYTFFLALSVIIMSGCTLQKKIENPNINEKHPLPQEQISGTNTQTNPPVSQNKDIKDVRNQITLINGIFKKDDKRFGEFDYIQHPTNEYINSKCLGSPSGCYQNENTKIRTIEIDEQGTFVYIGSPVFDEQGNTIEKTVPFIDRYNNEHPYTLVRPKKSKFDSAFIITVENGKVVLIREDYTS